MNKPNLRTARYTFRVGYPFAAGTYRTVYKTSRAKWAYKLDKVDKLECKYYGNAAEYKVYLQLKDRKLPPGVHIPEMHLLSNGMLAVQYVKGATPTNWCSVGYHADNCPEYNYADPSPCWTRKLEGMNFYISDLHSANVVVDDKGDVWIVDLGHGFWD